MARQNNSKVFKPSPPAVTSMRLLLRKVKKGDRVLDIGCGLGTLVMMLNKKGAKASGVTISFKEAERAQKLGRNVVQGNMFKLPVLPRTIDVAIMRHSLEHVNQPVKALEEAKRVLRGGGTLILVLPNLYSAPGHKKWYLPNLEVIRRVVLKAGFTIKSLYKREGYPKEIVAEAVKEA